jgi:hypothetical protein
MLTVADSGVTIFDNRARLERGHAADTGGGHGPEVDGRFREIGKCAG